MSFWRRWHRWLGTIAGVLLLLIGVTGVLLQIDEVTGITHKAQASAAKAVVLPPLDPVALVARVEALSGGRKIEMLRLEARKRGPGAIVRFAGAQSPVEIDLATGAQKPAVDAPRPEGGAWAKVRLLVLMLHTFGIAGMGGHIVGGIAGVAMAILCGSGLWIWWVMRKERVRRGSKATWLWK